jgi:hypothetical protein
MPSENPRRVAPLPLNPRFEVYTIIPDKGRRIVFYSDRSVHAINRDGSSEGIFRSISTVDALRESNMRTIIFTTGVVAVGLVLSIYFGGAIVGFFVVLVLCPINTFA